jgi:hypothetical protein
VCVCACVSPLNLYLVAAKCYNIHQQAIDDDDDGEQIFITFPPYALNQLSHPQNIAAILPIMTKPRVLSAVCEYMCARSPIHLSIRCSFFSHSAACCVLFK